ncbi:hypothetical protein [Streptomyces gibsoniae]|uniref:Uncharacterized protein n=1 Tax=Streptomyces gibsoniae TaxID=3075529 RepID=A0ABU2U6N1_9ACTN|nr:hypothetical protein [Streptomyces sp. DSM 41699]MDT0468890.1 hypothetical protein [Streptomyces sp. DSM 41699]
MARAGAVGLLRAVAVAVDGGVGGSPGAWAAEGLGPPRAARVADAPASLP